MHVLRHWKALVIAALALVIAIGAIPAVAAIDGSGSTRVQIRFMAEDVPVATRIVRAGDTLTPPDAPSAHQTGWSFSKWALVITTPDFRVVDLAPYTGHALTDDEIQDLITQTQATAAANNLYDTQMFAIYNDACSVRFHQYPFAVSKADPAKDEVFCYSDYTTLVDGHNTFDLSQVSQGFVPISDDAEAELVAWEAYAPGAAAGATPIATYDADKSLADVDADLELYPKLAGGFWVTLDSRGAGLIASVFVQNVGDGTGTLSFDKLPTEQTLAGAAYNAETGEFASSYRGWNQGYTLEGWYEDPECTTKVTTNKNMTKDITLYANWVPRSDTPYTVMHLIEGADGLAGQGTFEVYGTVQCTGVTDAAATPTEESGPNSFRYHVATEQETAANEAMQEGTAVSIAADGSSILRVYWPRNTYTYVFKRGSTVELTAPNVKWGQAWELYGNSTVYNSLYYNNNGKANYQGGGTYWGCSQSSKPYSELAAPTPAESTGIQNGGTVTMGRYTETFHTTRWKKIYLNVLEGQTPKNQTVTETIGGKEYTFELQNPNGAMRTDADYWRVVNTLLPTSEPTYIVGLRYKSGLVDMTSWTTIVSTTYRGIPYGSYKYYINCYYLRNNFELSFANVDGLLGDSVNTSSRNVTYGASLTNELPSLNEESLRVSNGSTYSFAGWFTDDYASRHPDEPESAQYAVDPATATMPGAATVLYAGWRVANFDVTFDAHGGTFPEAGEGTLSEDGHTLTYAGRESGTVINRPPTPTRVEGSTEYVFGGWYKDAALTQPFNFYTDTVGSANMTVHAKWLNNNPYTVSYHTSTGELIEHVDDTLYRFGSTVAVSGAPEEEPGTGAFLGWSRVKGNATRIVGQTFTIASDTDLFAVFGEAMPDALPTDTEESAPKVTLLSNYANIPDGTTPLTADLTYELQAKRVNDTVTLPSQLTTNVDGTSVTAGVSACRLSGWNTLANGKGTRYNSGDLVTVSSDTTLYAQWAPNQFAADAVAARAYTGEAQQPTPAVRDTVDDTVLVRDRDYELAWDNNVNAGTAKITITGKGDYAAAEPVTVEFVITPAKVTLAAVDKSTTFGDDPVELTWNATSGAIMEGDDLGVTLACEVTAETPAGTYPITITTTASPNYEVTLVSGTYTVVPDTNVAVQVSGYTGTYDGTAHGITVTPEPRGTTEVTVYYSREELTESNYASGATDPAEVAVASAGDTTVWWWLVATGDQTDSKGGSATVSLARASLTCTASDHTITYGDEPANNGVTWSGFVAGEDASVLDTAALTYSYNARPDESGAAYAAGSARGSYYIIPSGATSANYDITYVPGTLTVTARELGVAWSGGEFTYTGSSRHYDGATLTGLVDADKSRVQVGGYAGTTSATDVGSYTASVSSLTGEAARNYLLPANEHEWHITQASNALTVAIDGWTYGGAPNVPVITAGFGGSTAHVQWSTSADGPFADELPVGAGGTYPDVGTYYMRASIAETPNWQGATSRPVSFAVTARPLEVVADSLTVTYGSPVPDYTATWAGFAPGESQATPGVITGDLTLSCDYEALSPVGDYTVTPSGVAASSNYALTLKAGTLSVEPASLEDAQANMEGVSCVLNADSIVPVPASVTLAGVEGAGPGGALVLGTDYTVRYRRPGSDTLVDAIDGDGAWELVVIPASANFSGELVVSLDVPYATYQVAYDANLPTGASHEAAGMSAEPATWTYGAANANTLATAPTLVGWDFDGWALSSAGDVAYAAGSSTTDDLVAAPLPDGTSATTLYARWTPHTTAVTFDHAGATTAGSPGVTAIYDADMPAATMPQRTGYDFAGMWLDGPGGGVRYYETDGSSSRTWDVDAPTATLKARWTAGQFIVALDAPDATVMGTTSVTATFDADMPEATMPTRTGYDFAGYWDDDTGSCYYGADGRSAHAWDIASNDVTLAARWVPRTTAVSFDANGGSDASAGVTATYDATVPAIDRVPTRAGHTFLGFFATATGDATQYYGADGTPLAAWDVDTASSVLYARWSPRAYPVTFASELSQVTGGVFDVPLLTYDSPSITQGIADFGGRVGVVATAPADVTQTIDGGSIHHHLIGWAYSYTGADGLLHEGTFPVTTTTGQDSGYTGLDLFGLMDDELGEGATIVLTADYTIMPHLSATAQNGRVDVTAAGESPSPATTSDSLDVTHVPTAGALIGFEPTSQNWELPEDGITVRDQYGNEATVERTPGDKSITLGGRTVTVSLAFADGGTSAGTLTVVNMPDSAEAGVVLSVTFAYRFTRIQATFAQETWVEQADGSYARLGDAVTRPAQDAGSEAGVEVPQAPAGYLFDHVTYADAETDERASALPVRYDGSTMLRYYFDLVDYTVTLSSDVPAALEAEGWSGPAGGPWTHVFTVLDEVTLPTPVPASWTKDFLGWRETAGSEDVTTVPAGTTCDVAASARWRDLVVVGIPTIGEAPVYDGTPKDIPLVAPEGYAWDGAAIVVPVPETGDDEPSGPVVAATASGVLSAVEAGGYEATLTLGDGFVWDGGSRAPLAVTWEVAPADATGAVITAPRCVADGTPQRLTPTVVVGGRTLVEGRDYVVRWSDNVEPGIATITIEFRGNYAGLATGHFEIVSRRSVGSPMYRLYNPNSGEHFYTASTHERDVTQAAGWSYEGVGWVAPSSQGEPVFRLYNAFAGDHHYTLDAGERDALVAVGWTYEGVGWLSDAHRTQPVWRQYNPNALAGAHNFTTDEREHVTLCGLGWRGEGIAWYGV